MNRNPFALTIEEYLYRSFPFTPASAQTKDEAAWKAVLGTKQRRFGPLPPPEVQVAAREVLFKPGPVTFFSAWGASKQDPGRLYPDAAEVSALKQLACLRDELGRYGKDAWFVFRLEDAADVYLLGEGPVRREMVSTYSTNLARLIDVVLPGVAEVRYETDCTTAANFFRAADEVRPMFKDYLTTDCQKTLRRLEGYGWKGPVTREQREYYGRYYASLGYPPESTVEFTADYFASVLARTMVGALRLPDPGTFIQIAFTHPLPGVEGKAPRLFYRTIPERYTNHHQSPWLARGYLRIGEGDEVTPRFYTKDDRFTLVENPVVWNGVRLDLPYYQS